MPLVAPIVPENTGDTVAKIVAGTDLAGTFLKGFAAMSQANAQRKQLELDAQRLSQTFALQQDAHAIQREELAQQGEFRREQLESTKELNSAHAEYWRATGRAKVSGVRQGLLGQAEYNSQLHALHEDATGRARQLQLNDPKFQTENPIEFAANLQKFDDEYGQAPATTGIPSRLQQWKTIADQQKTRLKRGGGEGMLVPNWQIVRDLQNPETREQTINDLKASGHYSEETFETPKGEESLPKWQQWVNKHTAREGKRYKPSGVYRDTRMTPSALTADWLKKSETTDFSRRPSRVPDFVPQGAASTIIKSGRDIYQPREQQERETEMEPELPVSEEPTASTGTIGTPTETDTILAEARMTREKAKARGIDITEQLSAELQRLGIDPSQL